MALAARTLPPGGYALFAGMPAADRRHGLDVMLQLLDAGRDDPDLLAAALLHDAAKGRRMRLWHRVVGVLLDALAPSLLRRLAIDQPRSWRYPFHLYLHHGPMSAEAARAAGCSERTVGFIRGQAGGDADRALLAALRAADEAS
jgi:hypothetical protein